MSAGENKRSITVAIFTSLAVVILVSGIFILGGKQKRFEKIIFLKAVFNDVGGLKEGNNVFFTGVKIGTIKRIQILGNNKVQITMRIEEDKREFIRKDAKVKITSESLIGNKSILIYGGNQNFPSVEDNDKLESEIPLSTEDMMVTLQENNKNLVGITKDFKVLTGQLVNGQGTVGTLLTDSAMATSFRNVVINLEQVSQNTLRASGALSKFTTKLNSSNGLANELLTDTTIFNQLKSSVTELNHITSSTAQLTENLNKTSTKLNDKNNGVGVLLNDEDFAVKMKKTMENIETSSQKLDENMEALQHNFLTRGYFKKKAKKEAKAKESGEFK